MHVCMCVYIKESLAVHLKPTENCKPTIFQKNNPPIHIHTNTQHCADQTEQDLSQECLTLEE